MITLGSVALNYETIIKKTKTKMLFYPRVSNRAYHFRINHLYYIIIMKTNKNDVFYCYLLEDSHDWKPLINPFTGHQITNMDTAIAMVRATYHATAFNIGLAPRGQMQLNNPSWDNL